MSKVSIFRGISGSGKSTLAKSIPDAAIVSADDFFLKDGEYLFDSRKLSDAHAQCLRRYVGFLQIVSTLAIIVDNTNTTVEEIAPYYALAEAYEHEVEIVTVETPLEVCIARNVHDVDREVAIRQYQRLRSTKLPKRWKHRIVNGGDF